MPISGWNEEPLRTGNMVEVLDEPNHQLEKRARVCAGQLAASSWPGRAEGAAKPDGTPILYRVARLSCLALPPCQQN